MGRAVRLLGRHLIRTSTISTGTRRTDAALRHRQVPHFDWVKNIQIKSHRTGRPVVTADKTLFENNIPEQTTRCMELKRPTARRALRATYWCRRKCLSTTNTRRIRVGPRLKSAAGEYSAATSVRERAIHVYPRITGKRGDFQGCIIVDEMG